MFTDEQKRDAVVREIKLREWVYPARVAENKMTQKKADHELGVMRAILADYEAKVAATRLF